MSLGPRTLGSITLGAETIGLRLFRIRIAYTERLNGSQRSFVNDWLVRAHDSSDAERRAYNYLAQQVGQSDASWLLAVDHITITETTTLGPAAPTLRVVLTSGDTQVDDIFEEWVCEVVGTLRTVQSRRIRHDIALRNIFAGEDVHLLLIDLCSIVLSGLSESLASLGDVMDLVGFIRTRTNCPIIALWRCDYDHSVHARILAAGANFFFAVPFDRDAMLAALNVCARSWPVIRRNRVSAE